MKIRKHIFTLCFFCCGALVLQAQNRKTYDAQWKAVDELIQKKNLPRTALAEVKKIYLLAKKEGQDAQVIKALVYQINLQSENRETADKQAILEIQKELTTQKEPSASILKNLLATLYWQYFQQHRWALYNRTATTGFIKEDIATWGAEDFYKKISDLFLQSLQNKVLLQATRLNAYDAIIQKGNTRQLRPTLYNLLAHTALAYFKSGENDLKKPLFAFEMSDPAAYAPAAEFAAKNLITTDSLSAQYTALTIYQQLIRLHVKDVKKDALIDVDVDRLQFVHSSSTLADKDERYTSALQNLYNTYGTPASAAGYLLAVQYGALASTYHPLKDTTHRFKRVRATEILEQIVSDSSVKSEAWANSYNLLKELKRAKFSFEVEKVSIPGQPFRAYIKYTNLTTLHLQLVAATEALKKSAKEDQQAWWAQLAKAPSVRSWQQPLPATADMQEHSVEIKVDALPVGEYILFASNAEAPSDKSASGAQFFYMSNISWVNSGNGFYVLNRQTGQPLEGAAVQVYSQTYNYSTSRYTKTKFADYKTNNNGFFSITKKVEKNNRGYFLEVRHGNDYLFLDDMLYSYRSYNGQPLPEGVKQPKIFFFTDRSIYRPGQTIYFKGIVVQKEGAANSILTGHKTTLYLRNANYIITDSLQLTSNDYGSFNGKFTLPQNVLNGYFQLTDNDSRNSVSFSVEEYKRPKFYIDFAKIKETYQAGDTLSIFGTAKAYAGNNVDGARVSYRVVRQPRFMYPWLMWRWWQPQAEPMEIAHGTTTTDENGSFQIIFTAVPDKKIDKKLEPVFDYRIYADVTDVNGETRSDETIVSAGYKSLLLKTLVPQKTPKDSLLKLAVRTENMNGEYQAATVSVQAYKLVPEQRLVRNRYWQQPDLFVMSKPEFVAYFPNDEYKKETDLKTWEAGPLTFTKTVHTTADGMVIIDKGSLEPGFYRLEFISADKDGAEVKDVQYTEVYDDKSKALNHPSYLWTVGSTPIEPGEKTTVQIASAATDVYLIHGVDKNPKQNSSSEERTEVLRLSNEKKTFEYGASESDRGGYGVAYLFVKHNRFYNYSDVITVPWSNKELQIEYTTFRDKTLPGSAEKWTVKLTGYKGQMAAAEVLASMYDASLDGFKPHTWTRPSVWPLYGKSFRWQATQNFAPVQSIEKWMEQNDYKNFDKRYDQFIWQEYQLYRVLQGRSSGLEMQSKNQLSEVVVTGVQRKTANPAPTASQIESPNADMDASLGYADTSVTPKPIIDNSAIQIRKNFNETAFFFPDLRTDKEGNISFSFTTPEALTKWKLQTLGHTKDLAFGLSTKEAITQKELMVQPNAPRFLRQGDRLEFTVKIVNLSGKEMTGQAELQLIDAATGQSVDGWFLNSFPNQYFTVAAGQSEVVKFPVEVPFLFTSSLVWRVIAKSGNMSDGEEQTLPVLTNKVLVTETLPLPMRGSGTKTFTMQNLVKSQSETLVNHALTVTYTANPAWYAVQALPYLAEQKTESAEQIWNRYYANALASSIINSAPRIKEIMQRWKTTDTAALLSNLQKNEELKSALLEETPWVLQVKSETEQKKNIALLFDVVRMNSKLNTALQKLKTMQSPNGGFVWFKGGPDDRYMTQYILTGIGRLKKLNALPADQKAEMTNMIQAAMLYLDRKVKQDYDNLIKSKITLKTVGIDYYAVQYLYMRSFFPEYEVAPVFKTAYNFYRSAAAQNWIKGNKYTQGMTALMLYRTGDKNTSAAILKSLKETAIITEELGMYWTDNAFGYSWWWWQAPIETQALLIEAFYEIGKDNNTVDDLRTWLIKNKQTTAWRTSKATADACYAMLLQGTNWLESNPQVEIKLGNVVVSNASLKSEAGTGYFKQTIEPRMIKPDMGKITVTVQQPSNPSSVTPLSAASWGAVYWQYFEDMDKVGSAATPLQLTKKLFIEKNTDRGPILTPINDNYELHVGDKIKVRIELRVDRDMEYVHMKDLRASALEPVNVLSGYKWQAGLGYYETTKDASTSFYFNYLRKGTYVFEYPLFVTHAGSFSAGLTTIQSLYAPEFSSHSEGIRIKVE